MPVATPADSTVKDIFNADAQALLLQVIINTQRLHQIIRAEKHADGRLVLPEDAWAALDAGKEHVSYTVPVKRKDGIMITLELHAKRIDWDGIPAHIVLADDVTEREHQKAQIARYVQQLEGSMQATLEAVSNMVEMRDPYTAGHERRVGIIASDIAK